MPAIRFAQSPQLLRVANHYYSGVENKVWLKGVDNTFVISKFAGFICVARTTHLKGGRLGKLVIKEITNGDGDSNSTWRPVPVNEFVYAMIVRNDPNPDAYVILGDNEWPMTTVDTFRHFEKCQPYVT